MLARAATPGIRRRRNHRSGVISTSHSGSHSRLRRSHHDSIPIAPPACRRFSPTGFLAYRTRSSRSARISTCSPRSPG
ncbi:hypothetical protein ebA1944 [Aromatoleum aromaticum EbN1]|uniref:Uncharacterized protein n=1 Tax=Aromatoleum aromaticum (strain DSM 19018 / LMG 30748 / EbN1) TaxID=76114 RepID=Q5P666_AROAE|nr:hypothetical protein ebA1944 [Aromatoleum aromaticum EbN1]